MVVLVWLEDSYMGCILEAALCLVKNRESDENVQFDVNSIPRRWPQMLTL